MEEIDRYLDTRAKYDTDTASFNLYDLPTTANPAAGPEQATEALNSGRSFSGVRITSEQLPENVVLPAPPPDQEQGALFAMPQDASLRFILSALTDNPASPYSATADSYEFVSFGAAVHGKVWQEANGDIRFTADPDYVGNASFEYTLRSPAGDLVVRQAFVLVGDVNDLPVLHDDAFTLNEGETFALDRLLANDTDPEGDSLVLDHFRGIGH